MDEHVSKAITMGLLAKGVDVITAQDSGARQTDDIELIRRATAVGRVLFTNDKGFGEHVRGFYERGEDFTGVIFGPQSLGIGPTVKDLHLIAELMEPDEVRNIFSRLPL